MIAALILPDDCLMTEVEAAARKHGMHIITDGFRIVVSPVVPPGWRRTTVFHRSPPLTKEVTQCQTA